MFVMYDVCVYVLYIYMCFGVTTVTLHIVYRSGLLYGCLYMFCKHKLNYIYMYTRYKNPCMDPRIYIYHNQSIYVQQLLVFLFRLEKKRDDFSFLLTLFQFIGIGIDK